jgi:hypothetical protein
MERHKFFVEIASAQRFSDGGAMSFRSEDQFYVEIQCRDAIVGRQQLLAQYGGENRCNVVWEGRV